MYWDLACVSGPCVPSALPPPASSKAWPMDGILSNWDHALTGSISQQIGVHEASLCVLLALEHKINFLCWCFPHGVFSMCLAVLYRCVIFHHTNFGFMCICFEFTLLSNTQRTQNGSNSSHREHKNVLNAHWRQFSVMFLTHDDVIKWKHFPRYWPFVRGIHLSPVNSPHKGQWHGALMLSLICALNKRLNKQSWGWWFETPMRSLWRHCNDLLLFPLRFLFLSFASPVNISRAAIYIITKKTITVIRHRSRSHRYDIKVIPTQ